MGSGLKIALVNEYALPHAPGGAERSMDALARGLATRGHAVVVVTVGREGAQAQREERTDDERLREAGVAVRRVRRVATRSGGQAALPSYVFGNPAFQRGWARAVTAACADFGVDVVHAQGYDSFAAARAAGASLSRPSAATVRDYRALCPVSVCLHDQDRAPAGCRRDHFFECCALYRRQYDIRLSAAARARHDLRRHIEWSDSVRQRRALKDLSGAVFVSERIRRIYIEADLAPVRHAAIANPPEPMTREDFGSLPPEVPAEGPMLLFVGRFSRGKGAEVFTRAMTEVAARRPGIAWVVAGRREYEGEAPGAVFLGDQPHDVVRALYRRCDAVVVPSRWQEPLSRVVIESLGFGRPVIATDAGGNGELVADGVNGLLVPRNRPDRLAEAVLRFYDLDVATRAALGAAGAASAARALNPDALLSRIEEFYGELRP